MGRGSQFEVAQGKILFAKIKDAKVGEKVHFELSEPAPVKGDKAIPAGTERSLSGRLYKAEHRKWEYQGDPKDSIVLCLKDQAAGEAGEKYRIEITMGSIARSIINSLLSAQHFDDPKDIVTIAVYNNKKGYASVFVGLGIDGTGKAVSLPWKLSVEDMNKFITKEKKKAKDTNGKIVEKVQNNYLELDAQLLELFTNNVIAKLPQQQTSDGTEEAVTADASTDDLPF